MNLEFLTEYCTPVIVGICLGLGYVVKKWITDVDNKYIPTINAVLGIVLAAWLHAWSVTPEVILTGLFSGLAATGLYEAFRNVVEGGAKG